MYGLIWLTDLRNKLGRIDLLIMLTSALCHDLDHPGYNNVYQINAQTDLALRYNDISPLENHHCAVAFGILAKVRKKHDAFRTFGAFLNIVAFVTARLQHPEEPDQRAVQIHPRRNDQVRPQLTALFIYRGAAQF